MYNIFIDPIRITFPPFNTIGLLQCLRGFFKNQAHQRVLKVNISYGDLPFPRRWRTSLAALAGVRFPGFTFRAGSLPLIGSRARSTRTGATYFYSFKPKRIPCDRSFTVKFDYHIFHKAATPPRLSRSRCVCRNAVKRKPFDGDKPPITEPGRKIHRSHSYPVGWLKPRLAS